MPKFKSTGKNLTAERKVAWVKRELQTKVNESVVERGPLDKREVGKEAQGG